MTNEQFNACYRAVKEYLADIGFVPNGDMLKRLLKSAGNNQIHVASPESDISGRAGWYMNDILDSIKYENGKPSHFLQVSAEQQEFINTGDYGKLTEDANLFARALGEYVRVLYHEYTKHEEPDHDFTRYNRMHVREFYKTHNDIDELYKFKDKFDVFLCNLHELGVLSRKTLSKSMDNNNYKTDMQKNFFHQSLVASKSHSR